MHSDPELSAERSALELEELKLRIRELKLSVWRRPAAIAPIATVVAAIVGVAWGAASGFFDVSRRELAVSKRELEIETRMLRENRDRQTLQFHATVARQSKTIKQLEQQAKRLQQEVTNLSRPILENLSYDASASATPRPRIVLNLDGANFGPDPGRVDARLSYTCQKGYQETIYTGAQLTPTVVAWHNAQVRFTVAVSELAQVGPPLRGEVDGETHCRFDLNAGLTRADGRKTQYPLDIGFDSRVIAILWK